MQDYGIFIANAPEIMQYCSDIELASDENHHLFAWI